MKQICEAFVKKKNTICVTFEMQFVYLFCFIFVIGCLAVGCWMALTMRHFRPVTVCSSFALLPFASTKVPLNIVLRQLCLTVVFLLIEFFHLLRPLALWRLLTLALRNMLTDRYTTTSVSLLFGLSSTSLYAARDAHTQTHARTHINNETHTHSREPTNTAS